MARRIRVRDLAHEAGTDLDETLVTLWEAGIDSVESADSYISGSQLLRARQALGLESPKQLMLVSYWEQRSGLNRDQLAEKLLEVDVILPPNTRRIPRNSLRRLRALFPGPDRVEKAPEPRDTAAPIAPLEWKQVGATPIKFLPDATDIAKIHAALEEDFRDSGDPIEPPGVKDLGLLESAVHRPQTSFGEQVKYPSAEMAGAALFHSVALNHAFHNGNKRTALVSLLAFLHENGLQLTCSENDLFRITLRTAAHGLVAANLDSLADREVLYIATWIKNNSKPIRHGERPLQWFKLKRILRSFNCTYEPAPGVGNRLNVRRDIEKPRLLRGPARRTLSTQVRYAGDGTEASRNTIRKLRAELHLDEEHGVDSETFYSRGDPLDDFINQYRQILRRLARL